MYQGAPLQSSHKLKLNENGVCAQLWIVTYLPKRVYTIQNAKSRSYLVLSNGMWLKPVPSLLSIDLTHEWTYADQGEKAGWIIGSKGNDHTRMEWSISRHTTKSEETYV